MRARVARRERAFRLGPALFLFERAFEDLLERVKDVQRRFESLLLIGSPDPSWPERLGEIAAHVEAVDPGAGFASSAGGQQAKEDSLEFPRASFDLCIAAGTLDTVNDLPRVLLRIRYALKPDSLLIGAIPGGDTLPRLRSAMRAADAITGAAHPRVHPRIEAAALGQLLMAAGFLMPVVDVDRIAVSYRSFRHLVHDLRAMGATNVLSARSRRPLTRAALAAAEHQFTDAQQNGRTIEIFELIHFAAWTASAESGDYG